jgi:hypothetical protein
MSYSAGPEVFRTAVDEPYGLVLVEVETDAEAAESMLRVPAASFAASTLSYEDWAAGICARESRDAGASGIRE